MGDARKLHSAVFVPQLGREAEEEN